jgi:otoferlin
MSHVTMNVNLFCLFQTFQLRAHVYQARSLIGSDASGLSDPYAIVYVTEFSKSTQVIEETLSPTWDEQLVFDDVLVYGAKDEIQRDPPTIVIEIYDQDKVGKSEFIGRAVAKPKVKLKDNQYKTPALEWFEIIRGTDNAGELLAAFEMLEIGSNDLPALTEPKYIPSDGKSTLRPSSRVQLDFADRPISSSLQTTLSFR